MICAKLRKKANVRKQMANFLYLCSEIKPNLKIVMTELTALTAVSPIDGRYAVKCQ